MAENRVKCETGVVRRRRLFAGTLIGMVVLAVLIVLVAAHDPRHYVYLIPFGRTPVVMAVLMLSPAILGFAVWLLLRKKRAVRILASAVVALTVLMCAVGYRISATDSILEEVSADGGRTVVAVSPGGDFDLVVIDHVVLTTRYEIVRVRSRAGLTSREAGQDLACFVETFGQFDPENTFESARFVREYEVEVRTEAGGPWTTTFDKSTLLAAATVSHGCG
ncbi:hypothetical protein ACGFIR_24550 [Micromonospora sp. NPDC049051]|uniref:hypothetical protein n=1 Tax=unclassified Micromonospora TaxID=2617518 RepID=UPI00370FF215